MLGSRPDRIDRGDISSDFSAVAKGHCPGAITSAAQSPSAFTPQIVALGESDVHLQWDRCTRCADTTTPADRRAFCTAALVSAAASLPGAPIGRHSGEAMTAAARAPLTAIRPSSTTLHLQRSANVSVSQTKVPVGDG